MAVLDKALEGVARLFDAIPGNKKLAVMDEMVSVEVGLKSSVALLRLIRGYFANQPDGEYSPFVQRIDQLLSPRPEDKVANGEERIRLQDPPLPPPEQSSR